MNADNYEEQFTRTASSEEDTDSFVCLDTIEEIDAVTTKQPRRKNANYEAIRAKYIMGKRELTEDGVIHITNYTLQELATEFQCYFPLLQQRSAKEKWSLQRAAYKNRLQENAENTALNIYLHEGAIADTQAMIATNKLNKIYKMALSKYDSVIEAYDSDRALDEDEKIDIRELKDLLAIGKDLHTLSQQVVKSRTALVEKDMVKDLQQYKNRTPRKSAHVVDPASVEKRIAHLQNILAAATPHPPTNNE